MKQSFLLEALYTASKNAKNVPNSVEENARIL